LPPGVKPWFSDKSAKRIFDRSVVSLENHDGAAMMSLLNHAMEVEKSPLGGDNQFETTSLCRWQNESWFRQAEARGMTREQVQGTVIIDGRLMNAAFAQVFKECLEKLKALSK